MMVSIVGRQAVIASVAACVCVGAAACAASAKPADWAAQQTAEEIIEGRRVVRFEHECLTEWGYTGGVKQYFYVVEPRRKGQGPLLVCLHSAGGSGMSEMPPNVKFVAAAGDEFTGLIPNSGLDSEWWWGANEIKAHPDKYKDALTPVENRVLATIDLVASKYNIDRNRIYMRGISMGGSGTLGLGMSHGDIFAALLAGVPAGTAHATYRLSHFRAVDRRTGRASDAPPALVFFSHKDAWSEGMERWLEFARSNRLAMVAAWGPWGHENHYEMTDPAAYEFPWLSIKKNEAYPAFTNASSDSRYPGLQSDAPDQDGQLNAYFRWRVVSDRESVFAIELRLVRSDELHGAAGIPGAAVVDVTPRRLQRFRVVAGKAYTWRIEQPGSPAHSGRVTADDCGLLTVPRVVVSAKPLTLRLRPVK